MSEPFVVVPGDVVADVLARSHEAVLNAVRDAYLRHHAGDTVNPASKFLRFPDRPDARIIALPARLRTAGDDVAGVKWISSFPGNVAHNQQRASAVLILNDMRTGHPIACLEASRISAARTAASAVLAGEALASMAAPIRLAVVGAGVIARAVVDFALAREWPVRELAVCDLDPVAARAFVADVRARHSTVDAQVADTGSALPTAEVVVLCTNAGTPWLTDPAVFAPGSVVLHVSLRDLAPEVILASVNVLDDVDHCLTASTSVHLTEQRVGNRAFVHGTLAQVLTGEARLPAGGPRIFSPFGLGVLDLAVGGLVLDEVQRAGTGVVLPDFLGSTTRW